MRAQQQIILRRHEVQGRAYERRPDYLSLLHEPRELVAPEVPQAGPQANVGRAHHLRLEACQALYGIQDGERLPVQQHLAGEGGPVELPERQDTVGRAHQGRGSPSRK